MIYYKRKRNRCLDGILDLTELVNRLLLVILMSLEKYFWAWNYNQTKKRPLALNTQTLISSSVLFLSYKYDIVSINVTVKTGHFLCCVEQNYDGEGEKIVMLLIIN